MDLPVNGKNLFYRYPKISSPFIFALQWRVLKKDRLRYLINRVCYDVYIVKSTEDSWTAVSTEASFHTA